MIAIDTNVLVRVLVDDPGAMEQCRMARGLIALHDSLWVNQIVLIETIWVLQSCYQFEKAHIGLVLEKLIQHPHIQLENDAEVKAGLEVFHQSNVGFADCMILSDARQRQLQLYTFDRKLSALGGVWDLAKVEVDG